MASRDTMPLVAANPCSSPAGRSPQELNNEATPKDSLAVRTLGSPNRTTPRSQQLEPVVATGLGIRARRLVPRRRWTRATCAEFARVQAEGG